MSLGDLIEAVLMDLGPTSGSDIARGIGRRKDHVLRELRENPRFERVSRGRGSKWQLVEVEWPEGFQEAEEALVRLVRKKQHTPDEALLRIVCAWAVVA